MFRRKERKYIYSVLELRQSLGTTSTAHHGKSGSLLARKSQHTSTTSRDCGFESDVGDTSAPTYLSCYCQLRLMHGKGRLLPNADIAINTMGSSVCFPVSPGYSEGGQEPER